MTQKPAILFDLDGTLTDSGEGVMRCVALALTQLGLPVPGEQEMRTVVGPPLSESFAKFGVPAHQIEDAIALYRGRYNTVGKYENFVYPGIRQMLQDLQAQGFRLFVATSKPEALAIEVLEYFQLAQYFERICGASLDSSRSQKADVLAYLLRTISDVAGTIMVGDTIYDVLGAAEHGIPTVAVTWGYGIPEDMIQAGAIQAVDTPQELADYLCQAAS